MNPKEMTDGEILDRIYDIIGAEASADRKIAVIKELLEDCKTY